MTQTDDGAKTGYLYRIAAQQGEMTASVTGSWDWSRAGNPSFRVKDVQNGTAGVKYTAASPVGIGPWTFQWYKYNPTSGIFEALSGATANAYEISPVDCSKQGSYRVETSDSCTGSASVYPYLSIEGCPP